MGVLVGHLNRNLVASVGDRIPMNRVYLIQTRHFPTKRDTFVHM
jgi:hypothetical protein